MGYLFLEEGCMVLFIYKIIEDTIGVGGQTVQGGVNVSPCMG